MHRIFKITAVIFFLFTPASLFAEEIFSVRAYPDQNTAKPGMMFLVRAQVTNVTEGAVDFLAHNCAFERHWRTDHERVHIRSWTCNQDMVRKISLESGEVYEKSLLLFVSDIETPGPVTFRLGLSYTLENGDETEPAWSDPVTIKIRIPEEDPKKGEAGGVDETGDIARLEVSDSMPGDIDGDDPFPSDQESESPRNISG